MRISDWSSDVCSSDLLLALTDLRRLEHVVERAIELLAYSRHHRLEGLARLGHRALGADAVLAGIGEAGFRRLQRLVGPPEPRLALGQRVGSGAAARLGRTAPLGADREGVRYGESVSVHVDLGGGRTSTK